MVRPRLIVLCSLIVLLLVPLVTNVEGFQSPAVVVLTRNNNSRPKGTSLWENKNNEDLSYLAELKQRQLELETKSERMIEQWRQVQHCKSSTALVLPDWVRRISVDYPLIACGSASGELFVGHAETNKIVASTVTHNKKKETDEAVESDVVEENNNRLLEQTCRFLYGSYDGGGTIAVALRNKLLVDAPRTGGVRLHRIVKDSSKSSSSISSSGSNSDATAAAIAAAQSAKLIWQGGIPALEGSLVTCLDLQPDYLFVGTADGRVQAYSLEDEDLPLFLQTKPRYEWNLGSTATTADAGGDTVSSMGSRCSPITSLSVCSELRSVVATTAASSVQILTIPEDDGDDDDDEEDDDHEEVGSLRRQDLKPVASFYPPFDSTERKAINAFCLSAAFVKLSSNNGSYSIVCGGNDGSLFVQPLQVQRGSPSTSVVELALTRPLYSLRPIHMGPVMAVTSPAPGLVATTGQDGTLRMYEVGSHTGDSRCLYQFAGYKVWVGSLCTHGTKLFTDGADNTVIVHNFKGKNKDA